MTDKHPTLFERINDTAAYLRKQLPEGWTPDVSMILGSGLGPLADEVDALLTLPYTAIPGFGRSSVEGHAGKLVLGTLEGVKVIVMQGRLHYYEGYSLEQVTFPVRVMRALGAGTLIVTNASGGLNREFNKGDLMLMEDHINLLGWGGQNPLTGPNDERLGPRFPDIKPPYNPDLISLAERVGRECNIPLRKGVYIIVAGPTFETRAELELLRQWGGDAVGMSTVHEVIVARHGGMKVLGISSITNAALADAETGAETSHKEVQEVASEIGPRLSRLVRGVLADIKDV